MKNNGKQKKKILLSSTMKIWTGILVAIVLVAGTYAWFSANRIVKENNLNIALDYEDISISYEVYGFDEYIGKGVLLSSPTIRDIIFNEYDTIIQSRNRYTPIFARILLTRSQTMAESGTLEMEIFRDISKPQYESSGSKMSRYSSSIMRFSLMQDPTAESSPNPDTLYRTVDNAMYEDVKQLNRNETWSKVFTAYESSEDTYSFSKDDSIILQIPYDFKGKQSLSLILYISYDTGLINAFKDSESITGTISVGEQRIPFNNDLSHFKIYYPTMN